MNIYDIAQEAIKNRSSVSVSENKPVTKQNQSKKLGPHLAICTNDNPSANNRHNSLMLKSKEDIGFVTLIKSENVATEFDEFSKALADPHLLLDLYTFCKSSGEQEFIQSLIDYSKEQNK